MRIAIVEDEAMVARRLERMVREIVETNDIAIAPTLQSAFDLLRTRPIDLLFLDLNLQGQNGFRVLEEAAASSFQTIVVSAHHEQALRAFEYGVTDFVPKPWSEERLRRAIERVISREPQQRAKTLVVRKARELRAIATSEVTFIQAADDYAELHLSDGSVHLHEKSLSALEALLPDAFLRVHRSYVVNLAHARGIRNAPRVSVVLDNGELVPVGRIYRDDVRARIMATPLASHAAPGRHTEE